MRDQLENMIKDAKAQNDEVLAEYLTRALEHVIEKERQEEQSKQQEQLKQEEKKVEKPIKKQGHGEVTTITVYQDGNVSIESKYLDVPIHEKNIDLATAMRSIEINLGIDDVTNDHSSEEELLEALDKLKNKEDIEKLEVFLGEVAKVGKKGKELNEKYKASALENKDLPYDSEYQELLKQVSFAMQEDKENNSRFIDTNKYEETILTYQRLIRRMQTLIDEANNKMSREKIANLEMKIMQLQERITTMENKLKAAEDLSNYSFD